MPRTCALDDEHIGSANHDIANVAVQVMDGKDRHRGANDIPDLRQNGAVCVVFAPSDPPRRCRAFFCAERAMEAQQHTIDRQSCPQRVRHLSNQALKGRPPYRSAGPRFGVAQRDDLEAVLLAPGDKAIYDGITAAECCHLGPTQQTGSAVDTKMLKLGLKTDAG